MANAIATALYGGGTFNSKDGGRSGLARPIGGRACVVTRVRPCRPLYYKQGRELVDDGHEDVVRRYERTSVPGPSKGDGRVAVQHETGGLGAQTRAHTAHEADLGEAGGHCGGRGRGGWRVKPASNG